MIPPYSLVAAPMIALPPAIGAPQNPTKKLAQKKSMAKQKDATGRCAVRPQRAKDTNWDKTKGSKENLTELYTLLYARVPFNAPSDVALARGFSDKELRVLMGMNKMLINDYNTATGKYTEKTKANKIKALLPNLASLARPEDLDNVTKPKRAASRTQTPPSAAPAPASAPTSAPPPMPRSAVPQPSPGLMMADPIPAAGANFEFGSDSIAAGNEDVDSLVGSMKRSSLDDLDKLDSSFMGQGSAWLASSDPDTPDSFLEISAPAAIPLPLSDITGERLSVSGRFSMGVDSLDMESLQQSMQRNSLDDDTDATTPVARGSLDVLAEMDSTLMPAIFPIDAGDNELRQQQEEECHAQWQAQMNSRMLQGRQEHERQQRQRQQAAAVAQVDVSTPSEDVSKRKRGMSLTSQLGNAFRRNQRKNKGDDKFLSRHSLEEEQGQRDRQVQQYTTITPHPIVAAPEVVAVPATGTSKDFKSSGIGDTSRYMARREDRQVVLEVSPTGVTVIDGAAPQFFHLTTILSWRVRRNSQSEPVGFKLVFTDGSDIIFGTEQGREISDVMMQHAQGLAALMQGGMHTRGAAMVN